MQYRKLGDSDIKVSAICLGTMTWGQQNNEKEAHQQLNYAIDRGVNFIDTAEMYPVPPMKDTCFKTEKIIGNWLKDNKIREQIILATKVAGRTSKVDSGPPNLSWIRDGPKLNKKNIDEAIFGSLRRLNTDYIDLYQIHWPERIVNNFGSLGYSHEPRNDDTPISETLSILNFHVEAGRIRNIGLSNETAWGTLQFINLAKSLGLKKIVSIQNPYSLLNRSFEVNLSEISINENVGLLAYSPLAFGMLSGKYLDNAKPEKARITLFPKFKRYTSNKANDAVKEYFKLSKKNNLKLSHLALSFINSRDFVTSNIIGATNIEQLKQNIDSLEITLSEDILTQINEIHSKYTYPCP